MKITIHEDPDCLETEIVVHCRTASTQLLQAVELLHSSGSGKLPGSCQGEIFLLEPEELLYCDTVDKRVFLYTSQAVYETPLRLYEVEERLSSDDFFRASKSTLVSIQKIKSLRPEMGGRLELTLQGGERLTVSRLYAAALKEKLGLTGKERLR